MLTHRRVMTSRIFLKDDNSISVRLQSDEINNNRRINKMDKLATENLLFDNKSETLLALEVQS